MQNNNLTEKTGFYMIKKSSIFSNIYIILIILIIALIFVGTTLYFYLLKSDELKIINNSSYYGTDIALYEPIFQETTKTVNDCIAICSNDLSCDGITYNSDTQACLGTKNGQIRNELNNYSAWIKPVNVISLDKKKNLSKAVLVGYTKTSKNIDKSKMQNPYMIGYFSYSFNLTINDFYQNYGSWRHVFHKGTNIDKGTILSYQSWENLIVDFPLQSIGVWLAPFTNNLRIAITTNSLGNVNQGTYPDAFVEKCDEFGECYITDMPNGKWVDRHKLSDGSIDKPIINTYVEFFDNDLQNIPINKKIHITINFRGRDVEVYFNGKIVKISRLEGVPTINKSNLFVMNDKTFGGEIGNLIYYPDVLNLQDIKDIIDL